MNNLFELIDKLIELENKKITTFSGTGVKNYNPNFSFENFMVSDLAGDFIQLVKRGKPVFTLAID